MSNFRFGTVIGILKENVQANTREKVKDKIFTDAMEAAADTLGIPTQGFKTCFICGRHLAMNRIPIVISVSGKGNRFACDKCYKKSQREKEHEKTEL